MPRSKSVTLGGVTYQVTQLPMKLNREWRESLNAPIVSLIQLIQNYGDLELNAESLTRIIAIVKDLLLGSMDMLLDALFAYSPALAADRERIEREAYDDEAIAALGEVVRLAYPLDQVLTAFRGSPVMPMSTNLPSRNGANGTKSATAGRPRSTTKT